MENGRVVFIFILLHRVVLYYCQKVMVLARYRRNAFLKSCSSPSCLVVSIFSLIPFLLSILLPFNAFCESTLYPCDADSNAIVPGKLQDV